MLGLTGGEIEREYAKRFASGQVSRKWAKVFEHSPRLLAWLMMIGPGLGLIVGGCFSAWGRWNVLRRWRVTTGEVIAADVEVRADPGVGETSGEPTYLPRVMFRYEVDGREWVRMWTRGWSAGNQAETEQYVKTKYPFRSKHEIRYDPRDPARIQCEVEGTMRFFTPSLVLGGVGVVFLVGGFIFLLNVGK